MEFMKTGLKGSFVVCLDKIEDERGFFARTWDKKIFEGLDLNSGLLQCSISFNKLKGTLRGMHYQEAPYEEVKLVQCFRGRIFDVIIDLRPKSETFKQWFGVELGQDDYKMLYISEGFAHGFQTLENNTLIHYHISQEYKPEYARGMRWDDPAFNISWPIKQGITISKKDSSYPFLENMNLKEYDI